MHRHHQRMFIEGPAGRLESLYQRGQGGDMPAVVVCHPHPLFGGTMRNKVVYWIARVFEELGCPVVRFNFRGVEQSEGVWDEGQGEAEDAAAVFDWMEEQHPDAPLWLAGFSFGNYAGLQAARHDERIVSLFAIAPAVNIWPFDFMEGETRPLTVVQGTEDEIVPFHAVEEWVKHLPHASFHAINGAGHFFPDHMHQLQDALRLEVEQLL